MLQPEPGHKHLGNDVKEHQIAHSDGHALHDHHAMMIADFRKRFYVVVYRLSFFFMADGLF
jgi:Zn-dependent membrane protease YugP